MGCPTGQGWAPHYWNMWGLPGQLVAGKFTGQYLNGRGRAARQPPEQSREGGCTG